MNFVLIDTSAWIHALRPDGDPEVTASVAALLETGRAALCPMVRLELWNGARGEHEKAVVQVFADAWEAACRLARAARKKGKTIPATDLLVAACARHHGVEILHDDAHFKAISDITGA